MKTRFLRLALLAVFCIGTAVTNAQISGFTEVRNANVVKEPIASLDLAAKAVEKGKVIVMLDGIEISREKFKSLNPNSIEKMELLKGESMKVLYGEKGADGVLRITSKSENSQEAQVSGFTSVRRGNVTTETNVPVHIRGSVANPQTKLSEEAVKVVKELKQVDTKGLSAEEAQTVMKVLNQIKRENSPRVEMLKVHHRGSQKCYPCVELAGMKVEAISIAEKPLFILDGKEISIEEFNGLNPNCVEDLKIIKGEEAVNKYGEKAANGVFLITAKKDCKQQKIDNEDVEIVYHGKVISKEEAEKMGISVNVIVKEIKDNQQQIVDAKRQRIAEMRQRQTAPQQVQNVVDIEVDLGKESVIVYNGKEISKDEAEKLGISIEGLERALAELKDELQIELKHLRVADVLQHQTAPQKEIQGSGYMSIRPGNIDTKNIASKELAVQAIEQGQILIILDGIEISEEKFKSLDPNSIERLELIKGETMKVLYGEKAANGVIFITSMKAAAENEQRAARRANAQNVHVVTKADLKPVDSATKVKAISIFEPTFHVRGSMARIENINSDELPRITKFKQNGNQVSFRIEIPKSENTKKQKFDIQYTLPTEM